jgi:hypothetical protein
MKGERDMKKLMLAMVVVGLSIPAAALAATWEKAPLMDKNCVGKFGSNPDSHPTACLLKCASSGYGIMADGKWLKLDKAGNEKAMAALKATKKKDAVRVNVTGEMKGDEIAVSSLAIPE